MMINRAIRAAKRSADARYLHRRPLLLPRQLLVRTVESDHRRTTKVRLCGWG